MCRAFVLFFSLEPLESVQFMGISATTMVTIRDGGLSDIFLGFDIFRFHLTRISSQVGVLCVEGG